LAKQKKSEYPEQNADWLLVEHYRKIGSKFGCLYCTKTHAIKDCPHKKEETKPSFDYKTMYDEDKENDDRYISYGW